MALVYKSAAYRPFSAVSDNRLSLIHIYCEYYRADKLVAELTRDENLEVSDACLLYTSYILKQEKSKKPSYKERVVSQLYNLSKNVLSLLLRKKKSIPATHA